MQRRLLYDLVFNRRWYIRMACELNYWKGRTGGVIGNIIAGIIGSWVGSKLLGSFGPVIGGYAIIPALIGAIILIFIVSFLLRAMRK